MTLHPLDARRIRDLGLDYLIAKKLTRAALRSFDLGFDEFLARDLGAATDSAVLTGVLDRRLRASLALMERIDPSFAAAIRLAHDALTASAPQDLDGAVGDFVTETGAVILSREGDAPFVLGKAFELQISPQTSGLLGTLALARHGLHVLRTGDRTIPLAAPLRPRAEVPAPAGWDAAGADAVELIEVLDVIDPWAAKTRVSVRAALDDLAPRIRWRGVHMNNVMSENDDRRWATAVVEAVREIAPARYWTVVDRFGEYHRAAAVRRLTEVLEGIADPEVIIRRVAEPTANDAGDFDFNMSQACGVPGIRPCFVIGTRCFSGATVIEDLRRAIEGRPA